MLIRCQGTPPYTSGEILTLQPYFSGFHGDGDHVFHDAVHDLESFFWVLVHICITRQGPGGVRREELVRKDQEDEEYSTLRRVVYCFFDSDNHTMQANKQHVFQNPRNLERFVLDNFHGYFQKLKEPVREWFHVLQLAHKFHAFEYQDIHDMVLEILNNALDLMPVDEIDDAAWAVLNDRKADIEQLHGNPFGKVQHPPPPHTSPTGQGQGSVPYSSPSSPTRPPAKKSKMLSGQGNIV